MDYKEEQSMEIEALESILMDDLKSKTFQMWCIVNALSNVAFILFEDPVKLITGVVQSLPRECIVTD